MQFIGTKFSITLGAWRLRFVLALEEADDDFPGGRRAPHHVSVSRPSTGSGQAGSAVR